MALDLPAADAQLVKPDPIRLAAAIQADYRFIWRLLRRFGVPELHAEDAAQQVFLVVAERLTDIAPGRERAFAFGTALRLAQSTRRKLGRELPSEQLDERAAIAAGPDELLDQKRSRELLDRCLQELPLELRTVFVLFELEALSSPEIAVLLDIPLGTVASRLRRAREQFKAHAHEHESGRADKREGQ